MLSSIPENDRVRIAARWIASVERSERGLRGLQTAESDRFRDPVGYLYRTAFPLLVAAVLDGEQGGPVSRAIEDLARVWALEVAQPEDAARLIEAVRPILKKAAARLISSGARANPCGDLPGADDGHGRAAACESDSATIDARIAELAARVVAAVASCRDQMAMLRAREAARLRHVEERRQCRSGQHSAR